MKEVDVRPKSLLNRMKTLLSKDAHNVVKQKPSPLAHFPKQVSTKRESSKQREQPSAGCPQYFGYLANRPKDVSIPEVCLTCLKLTDCLLETASNH